MKSRAYQTTPTPVLDLLPSLLTTKTNRPHGTRRQRRHGAPSQKLGNAAGSPHAELHNGVGRGAYRARMIAAAACRRTLNNSRRTVCISL